MKPSKPHNGATWTSARFASFIKSALRAASRRWPQKHEALKKSCIGKRLNKATGNDVFHYKCAACANLFKAVEVQVDHVNPVVSVEKGFEGWDVYIERMFCEADGYQVLCKPCHAIKTANERKLRKENRDEN